MEILVKVVPLDNIVLDAARIGAFGGIKLCNNGKISVDHGRIV